jgi:signal transduction histidine kinase
MPAEALGLGGVPGRPAAPGPPVEQLALTRALERFTSASARLEEEYAALEERLGELTAELEEKNRLLAASLDRERRLEAAALRASRLAAMGEMAATLAHEVRNPLGAMELCTGLLLQDLRDRPETERLARQVARGIADLNHLVTNLLEFTRAPTPCGTLVDCCALVEETLQYTADLRAASGVTVVRRYAAPSVPALADPHLLRPALLNLVRNAVEAMAAGGTLTVSAEARRSGSRICVADTGPGIPPAARRRVFQPFYTTRARGTGLGLPVTRALVTAMGGRLRLESEVGKGTTFTVILPRRGPDGGEGEHG